MRSIAERSSPEQLGRPPPEDVSADRGRSVEIDEVVLDGDQSGCSASCHPDPDQVLRTGPVSKLACPAPVAVPWVGGSLRAADEPDRRTYGRLLASVPDLRFRDANHQTEDQPLRTTPSREKCQGSPPRRWPLSRRTRLRPGAPHANSPATMPSDSPAAWRRARSATCSPRTTMAPRCTATCNFPDARSHEKRVPTTSMVARPHSICHRRGPPGRTSKKALPRCKTASRTTLVVGREVYTSPAVCLIAREARGPRQARRARLGVVPCITDPAICPVCAAE